MDNGNVRQFKGEKSWVVNEWKRRWSNSLVWRAMHIKIRHNFSTRHIGKLSSLTTSAKESKEKELLSSRPLPLGMGTGSTTLESNLAISNKIENWYSNSISNVYTMENFTQVYKVEHKTVFIAWLFRTEQIGSSSNACQWGKWINKMLYIHMTE